MANNISIKDGASGDVVVKSTDTAGVHVPHHNVDASALPTGAATETTLNSIKTAVEGTLVVNGSGVTQPVSGTVTADLGATDNAVLDAIAASLALLDNSIATGNELQVDVVGAIPAGTNNIGDVDVLSIVPGTAATSLGKAEDAIHSSGDVGVMMLAVRQNSQVDLGADGDYLPPTIDDAGGLRVSIVAGAGSGGTASADDADFTAGTTSGTPMMGVYETTPTQVTAGDMGVARIDVDRNLVVAAIPGAAQKLDDGAFALTTDSVIMIGAIRDDSLTTLTAVEADAVPLRVSSTGALHVTGGGGGTEYTEDVATANPIVGTATMMERDDALSTLTPIEGDWAGLRCNSTGALWTAITGTVVVDGSGVTQPVSGTITANLSATDNAVLDTIDAVLNTINGKLVTGTVIGDVNLGATDNAVLDTIAASLALLDNAIATGNELQVDVVAAIPAGTNLIGDFGLSGARTAGGTTPFRSIDLDETEEEVKATAGQLYWVHAINMAATIRFLKVYNATAANVTVGTTTPVFTFPIPPNSTTGGGFVLVVPNGIAFGTAITIAATTGVADADTGAPGANEVIVNLGFA